METKTKNQILEFFFPFKFLRDLKNVFRNLENKKLIILSNKTIFGKKKQKTNPLQKKKKYTPKIMRFIIIILLYIVELND